MQVSPSPIVDLNRAVAVGMAFGPETGLELVDILTSEQRCSQACAATCLQSLVVSFNEAGEEFKRAVLLTRNVRERELLLERAVIMMKGKTE